MTRYHGGIRVLIALFALLTVQPCLGRQADSDPVEPANEAVRQLMEAMEIAGISATLEEPDGPVASDWQMNAWEAEDGSSDGQILAIFIQDDVLLAFPGAFNLSLCQHLDACRRVIAESYWKLNNRVRFGFDPRDGEVRASVRLIGMAGRVDPKVLRDSMESLLRAVDGISWTMWKAMDTGDVSWPSDDVGPVSENAVLSWQVDGVDATVAVAGWVEKEVFASTVIAFDDFGRTIVPMSDSEAERFGSALLADYRDGPLSRVLHRDWEQFWQWVKWHYPPISVRVWAPPGTIVRGVVRNSEFFTRPCEASVTVDRTGESEIDFLPDWNREALLSLDASKRVEFEFDFGGDVARADAEQRTFREQAQLFPVGIAQLDLPLSLPLAIHIDETHPWIDGLLAEAVENGVATSLGNAASLSRREQVLQLLAVWKVFRDRGITYSNIASADASRNGQRVRAIHESLEGSQANCLDGSAALASVLAALDFEVYPVTLPGHAMVAVLLNADESEDGEEGIPKLIGIETTVIGREYEDERTPEAWMRRFEDSAGIPAAAEADWENFAWATGMGTYSLWSAIDQVDARTISLDLLRRYGLDPVPSLRSRIGRLAGRPDLAAVRSRRAASDARLDAEERAAREDDASSPR